MHVVLEQCCCISHACDAVALQKTCEYSIGELHGQGEGLAQALRQVPMQYFTEEFDLTRCIHSCEPFTDHELCFLQ